MKYKPLDKVRIKSLDWYNENKDEYGNINISHDFIFFHADRSKYCGKVFTIDAVFYNCYTVKEDNHEYHWTDEMIEGLVEEEIPLDKAGQMMDFEYEGLTYALPEGYIFKDENDNVINATKIVLEKKKKEYPKTYEECCVALEYIPHTDDIIGYKWDILESLQKLLICRDAYWKVSGGEYAFDYDLDEVLYYIYTDEYGDIVKSDDMKGRNCMLCFPTEEAQEAFYENFKELIEQCKELL